MSATAAYAQFQTMHTIVFPAGNHRIFIGLLGESENHICT
jgi:hypothetical protein